MILEVDRTDYRNTRLVDEPPEPLDDGQVRLAVDRFALTANNISYAVSGDMLGYWGFFPTEEGWGRIPAMALVTVAESAHPEIHTGGRYFGFVPMADEVVIDATPLGSGFRDTGAHRANHAATYIEFTDLDQDPSFSDTTVDRYLLIRGLFVTSFLIDDYLADNGDFDARQVIVTSASSKTSIALAFCLRRRGMAAFALTSVTNRDFVENLGLYDTVITYDDIETLDATTRTNVVDMAGNSSVLGQVHAHFGDQLGYSGLVGATHWEEIGGAEVPAGPTPQFFFAPAQIQRRTTEWGPAELQRRLADAFTAFVDDTSRWLTVLHAHGPDASQAAYLEMVNGATPPSTGLILSMGAADGKEARRDG